MARKASTPSYTVEYALSFDDANPSSVLDKLDKIAIAIYNDILNEGLEGAIIFNGTGDIVLGDLLESRGIKCERD